MKKKIAKEIFIEDLIEILPDSVLFLQRHGIRCLKCGEPTWGTLESAAKEKGFEADKIEEIVSELNKML